MSSSFFLHHIESCSTQMAQKKNTRNCEGVCKKLYNAVSPFRARICRLSHHPVENTSPQNKPVHVFHHQPSLSKTVPVEFEPPAAHFSAQKNKKLAVLPSPAVVHSFGEREIEIVGGQKDARKAAELAGQPEKAVATVSGNGQVEKVGLMSSKGKYSRKDDDSVHEGRFSEYIEKVKKRMINTASNVGAEKSVSFK
ncbi:hypothetical protein Salat_0505000 [Sesamum alatum]|uniref:Uncharacterized protein n=1 Tax=Sesamum alatum TaxID=300844 RepID=A0AAE1Z4C7_9LAMI|nr:hypothetical protein Salat_0505000 [Sesamum alatum]